MDQAVLATQIWLNKTYTGKGGYTPAEENGKTGWSTIKRLTTALQIELGISTPNGNFGPTTASTFRNLSIGSSAKNQIYILQGALYCKGYNPGGLTGEFNNATIAAIRKLQSDVGFLTQDGIVDSLLMKSLLTMDAFVLLNWGGYHGDSNIRTIQQNLNRDYISNEYFAKNIGLVPCDGVYGRSTNKALLYALQIEEGISAPNGVFGPSTKSKCPVLSFGSTNYKFIRLLKYALYCNGFNPGGFDGEYNNSTKKAVSDFQAFSGLNTNGAANLETWSSLLVSTGDTTRKGTMCDCSTTITPAKAKTLVDNKYISVGRYLTGKFKMTHAELNVIFSAGLKVFPIFETGGYKLSYFSQGQGTKDAEKAIKVAKDFGFKSDTIIYFTVDFDALDGDVTSSVLPYFKEIHEVFKSSSIGYKVGIYAPRNVCSRVSAAGYSSSSFICDMSAGFSGNLGYPLPKDWAIDQISTITIGNGEGQIEIDNNISSGKDTGVSSVDYSFESITIKTGKVVNVGDHLNVRQGAGTNYSVVGQLHLGDSVEIIEEMGSWYKIKFNNSYAFVYTQYIDTSIEYKTIETGKVVNVGDHLNVRQGAGTNYSVVGQLHLDDSVEIIAEAGDWYKIKFNSTYGFVFKQYINIEDITNKPKYINGFYNREDAVRYATNPEYVTLEDYKENSLVENTLELFNKLFRKYNHDYIRYGNLFTTFLRGSDCANFVSQALHAGGIPTTNDWNFKWLMQVMIDNTENPVVKTKYDFIEAEPNTPTYYNNIKKCISKAPVPTLTWSTVTAQNKYFKENYGEYELVITSKDELIDAVIKNKIAIGDPVYLENKATSELFHAMIVTEIDDDSIRICGHNKDRINCLLTDLEDFKKNKVRIIHMK